MKSKLVIIIIFMIFLMPISNVMAKSGCCSWHGGVAGCSSSGKQICKDGSLSKTCTCAPTYVYGCTDINANNYNSNANKNDGSCKYDIKGCTDSKANNYNKDANVDDGSCSYDIYGCTDKAATNYNSSANKDDGSCIIETNIIEKNDKNKKDENMNNDQNSSIAILYIYTVFFAIICLLKNKHNNLIINKINEKKNYKVALYILYYILIIPAFIDIIILIINYIKNKTNVS